MPMKKKKNLERKGKQINKNEATVGEEKKKGEFQFFNIFLEKNLF